LLILLRFLFQPALNIIKLGPGQADVKKVEHNGLIITTSKKEYRLVSMATVLYDLKLCT
jgi:hypothetical protein